MHALSPLTFSSLLALHSYLYPNFSKKTSDFSQDLNLMEFLAVLKNKEFNHPVEKELTMKLLKNTKQEGS